MASFGLIGVGAIAEMIVEGLMRCDVQATALLSPRGTEISAALAARFANVVVARDNQMVIDSTNIVLVSLRPVDAGPVLSSLRFRSDQAVASAMAGVGMSALQGLVAPAMACRCIPLPSIVYGVSPTPVFPPIKAALALFGIIGGIIEIASEREFDAFSAATGTIAAHIAYLAAIADWLASQGVQTITADRFIASMFGTLDLDPSTGEPLRDLARRHTTPGGINEAFATQLAAAGLPDAVRDGLDRLLDRLTR